MKRLFYKIKRTIQFLPIVWRGFDFDFGYAEDLYLYQLERTLKLLKNSKYHDNKYSISKLTTYINLYKKVKNEDYLNEYHDIIKEKYNDENIFELIFEPIEGKNTYSMYMAYQDYINAESIETDIQHYRMIGQKKHKKAERLLMEYWLKYRGQWWD